MKRINTFLLKIERRHELLRGWWIKRRGATAGRRFGLGAGLRILYPECLTVGDDVSIEGPGYLHCLSESGVRIGSNSSISRNVWLHCGSAPDHDVQGYFEMGEHSFIGPNAVIGPSGGVKIGSHVMIGPNLTISSENHRFDDTGLRIAEQGVARSSVLISDNCWIASNVTILAGVTLDEGCVVAAGAVVTKDVAPNSVVGGVPARLLRMRGQMDGRDNKV